MSDVSSKVERPIVCRVFESRLSMAHGHTCHTWMCSYTIELSSQHFFHSSPCSFDPSCSLCPSSIAMRTPSCSFPHLNPNAHSHFRRISSVFPSRWTDGMYGRGIELANQTPTSTRCSKIWAKRRDQCRVSGLEVSLRQVFQVDALE